MTLCNGQKVTATIAAEVKYPQAAGAVIKVIENVKDKADQAEQFITHQLDALIGQ